MFKTNYVVAIVGVALTATCLLLPPVARVEATVHINCPGTFNNCQAIIPTPSGCYYRAGILNHHEIDQCCGDPPYHRVTGTQDVFYCPVSLVCPSGTTILCNGPNTQKYCERTSVSYGAECEPPGP